MLAILNCIHGEAPRSGFDQHTVPRLAELARDDVWVHHLMKEGPLPDAAAADRLLISGSELSASEPHPRDEDLFDCLASFLDAEKPVLGICYGHQMLARLLGGDQACRRSTTPEFGWKRLVLGRPNALFDGIDDLVSAHSHYDEVVSLPGSCDVIASTDRCAIQAFQMRDAPVWGVQFHPEIGHGQGQAMFEENLRDDPAIASYFRDELPDPALLEANDRIFLNFFKTV